MINTWFNSTCLLFLRMDLQGQTCRCSPGILWAKHTSSGRLVTPAIVESVCQANQAMGLKRDSRKELMLRLRTFLPLLSGPRVMDYKYQPEASHRCKRDVLLCRLKNTDDPTWKRIRPRPARNNFLGAFVLCKGTCI